jgi:Uma2 family endonuclease
MEIMATKTKRWTLAELDRLPDDGNRYEVVRGELFVTPAPSPGHEAVLGRLLGLLFPYVERHGLGRVYFPRSIVRFEDSEVEPDLMVRPKLPDDVTDWSQAPVPLLVVEVLSAVTRRRDQIEKRQLYLDAGIAEYWIIDRDERSVRVVSNANEDGVFKDQMTWFPVGAVEPLTFDVRGLFEG